MLVLLMMQHNKDLAKRTISDKIFKHKASEIARDQKHEGFQRALTGMAYTFFDKKIGLRVSVNEEPAEELHKPVIKIFKRRKN